MLNFGIIKKLYLYVTVLPVNLYKYGTKHNVVFNLSEVILNGYKIFLYKSIATMRLRSLLKYVQ
jgi:hypothetical protein